VGRTEGRIVVNDDTITVVEDYCIACEGKCTNDDPEDYDHLMAEWDSLTGCWMDKGVSPSSIWAFTASVLLAIARENGLEWEEVQESLASAWKKGTAEDG
jgi:hypothetical protein